jgi:hypothetical protein
VKIGRERLQGTRAVAGCIQIIQSQQQLTPRQTGIQPGQQGRAEIAPAVTLLAALLPLDQLVLEVEWQDQSHPGVGNHQDQSKSSDHKGRCSAGIGFNADPCQEQRLQAKP